MATAAKSGNKTRFVQEFLQNNPQGNVQGVNEAWAAAGMKGTIGDTLIYKTRSELGLSGTGRAKLKRGTAAKAKSGTKVSKAATSPGKSMFVKEFLNDHPHGNVKAVNEAWQTAGFDGTISKTVVEKARALLGLTRSLRGNNMKSNSSAAGKKRGRPRKKTAAAGSEQRRSIIGARTAVLNDLEADIDRLIFKAMAVGDLVEIEDSLRRTRRLLYVALTRG
jgi:hypothetical protein